MDFGGLESTVARDADALAERRAADDGRGAWGEAYGRIAAHPQFARAARGLAANMLADAAGDAALDGVFKDAGRYVAGMIVAYLHVTGGLSLPRLRAIGAASGLLSPGRARSIIAYLSYLGFLEADTADRGMQAGDIACAPRRRGGSGLIRPTPGYLTAWGTHFRAALEAAAIVEPAADELLRKLEAPAAFAAFLRLQCESLLHATAGPNPFPDVLGVFLHRLAGWQIVSALLGPLEAMGRGEAAFPPLGPISFSVAATARRFGVSRAHVRRMIAHAERVGFLARRDEATLVLSDSGQAQIARFYAFQLANLAVAAAKALAEIDAAAPPARTSA